MNEKTDQNGTLSPEHSGADDNTSEPMPGENNTKSGITLTNEKSSYVDTANVNEDTGIVNKFRNNVEFRLRFMHTGFVWWGFVTLGWVVALGGTGFPDIRLIIDKDLETASWLFTAGAIGYMIGAFLGGLLFDRINRLLLLTTVLVFMAVSEVAIPWCDNFALMIVVSTLNSFFSGGLDVSGNSHIASLCGAEAGPYMHSIHFGFSMGGILSPLTAEPFLAEKTCKATATHNASGISPSTTATFPTTTDGCDEVYGETRVHYAYAIGGALILSAAVPFLAMYFSSGKYSRKNNQETKAENPTEQHSSDLPVLSLKMKIVFLFFLSSLLACYCAIEGRFSGLLMTFVVEHLDWTKSNGARVNTVFWAAFSAGRFLGIIVTRFLKPSTMLIIYLTLLSATFVGFLAASLFNITWLIWVMTALAGLAMSIVFPSIFTWTAESILPITGTISGIYLLSVSVANMLLPLLYGHLMDNYTQMWFAYLLLAQCVVCLLLYVVILLLVRKYITPYRKQEKIQPEFYRQTM